MKTFTVKITKPDDKSVFIPNCVIYQGKVCQQTKKGIGKSHTVGGIFNGEGDCWEEYNKYEDCYKAYINSTLMPENGLTQSECTKLLNQDWNNAFTDDRIFKCLFVMGENPNGYMVEDQDEIASKKEIEREQSDKAAYAEKLKVIDFSDGFFGYTVMRLPVEIWNIIKPFSIYHTGDEEDQEWADDQGYFNASKYDLKGYFYTEKALQALLNSGYRVSFSSYEIKDVSDMKEVRAQIKLQEDISNSIIHQYNLEKSDLIAKRRKYYNKGTYMTEEECNNIGNLPEIMFPEIEVSGHDIWGGGIYFQEDADNLYIIRNNGGDGDDWSQNNYSTGGAGAIAVKVSKTEDVIKYLNDVREFIKNPLLLRLSQKTKNP